MGLTDLERSPAGEIITFYVWPDATLVQIQKVRKGLKAHSQFQRIEKLEGNVSKLPDTMEIYRDTRGNYIGFLHKRLRHEKTQIISSPSSSPIVDDILGRDNTYEMSF